MRAVFLVGLVASLLGVGGPALAAGPRNACTQLCKETLQSDEAACGPACKGPCRDQKQTCQDSVPTVADCLDPCPKQIRYFGCLGVANCERDCQHTHRQVLHKKCDVPFGQCTRKCGNRCRKAAQTAYRQCKKTCQGRAADVRFLARAKTSACVDGCVAGRVGCVRATAGDCYDNCDNTCDENTYALGICQGQCLAQHQAAATNCFDAYDACCASCDGTCPPPPTIPEAFKPATTTTSSSTTSSSSATTSTTVRTALGAG